MKVILQLSALVVVSMEEHAVHQECVHVLQDGPVTIVNKVRRDVGMSNIYLMIIFKTSMNVMVIMSVIKSVLTLMDLLCVHVMMDICYRLMEELVRVCIVCVKQRTLCVC